MSRVGRRVFAAVVVVALAGTVVSGREAQAAIAGSLHLDMTSRPNGAIGLVGDSLTYSYFDGIDDTFRAQQWGPIGIEARSARRTTVTTSVATSGLDAVRRLRSRGFDAQIWIVALGTNDSNLVSSSPALADQLIDTMMAEIGADRRVVWVNVYARSGNSMTNAVLFNKRLIAATGRHPLLTVADWHSLASANPGWFVDNVHTNLAGAIARNAFVAAVALTPRCPVLVPAAPIPAPGSELAPADATAVATGRCLV